MTFGALLPALPFFVGAEALVAGAPDQFDVVDIDSKFAVLVAAVLFVQCGYERVAAFQGGAIRSNVREVRVETARELLTQDGLGAGRLKPTDEDLMKLLNFRFAGTPERVSLQLLKETHG